MADSLGLHIIILRFEMYVITILRIQSSIYIDGFNSVVKCPSSVMSRDEDLAGFKYYRSY